MFFVCYSILRTPFFVQVSYDSVEHMLMSRSTMASHHSSLTPYLSHEFIQTVANRIIELTPNGIIDKVMEYDEYITSDQIKEMRA